MILHRDSPEIEPEEPDPSQVRSSRRFTRLIESSASRRLSRPKLTLALIILTAFVAAAFVGLKVVESITAAVATQTDQQLPFAQIELAPAPDPWVIGGKAKILEEVRIAAKYPDRISLLGLDLKELVKDFRRCPWVKHVVKVERSYGRLVVQLVYRKPVAVVVVVSGGMQIAYPVDEEGVPLPDKEIDWTRKEPPFQVLGISTPLIQIRGVESTAEPKFGVPWKRAGAVGTIDDPDPMVLGATRVAEFLQRHPRSNPTNRNAPNFVWIRIPDKPINSFSLKDSEQNWVEWGKPPGDENPGEPSSEARWKMLLDWIERNGPLNAKIPNYLQFTRSGAELVDRTNPKKRK